jgi:TRAP-type transport system periplasmic protein
MKAYSWLASTIVSAAVTGTMLVGGAAYAQDKPVEIRFSHWVPPTHPLQAAITEWGESLNKASDGTISVTIFPAQQLGAAKDTYDMVRDGIADMGYINPGYTPGRFPIFDAANLPFNITNATDGSSAIDEWYGHYADKEMGDIYVCLANAHDPGTFHSKEPIVVPGDVDGVKVRPANGTISKMVTMLGGQPVQVSAPEAREALERGVAEAITFPWGSILLFGIDKSVKYHLDMPTYVVGFVWGMNKDFYNNLSDAQKKAVDDHCNPEWAKQTSVGWATYESGGRDKIKAMSDHTVTTPTDEQVAEWRKAVAPMEEEWKKAVNDAGGDADAIKADLDETLKKYNSKY